MGRSGGSRVVLAGWSGGRGKLVGPNWGEGLPGQMAKNSLIRVGWSGNSATLGMCCQCVSVFRRSG